jgi:hypothetical protein
MRHTVIGIFDTYDQAEVARSALMASGFARADIELQAAPESSSPDDPALEPGAVQPPETGGVLANIERFFSMLFGGRDQPPEVAHYSEAVRRGGILVAVDTPSEDRADAARQTLAEQGAIDIDERAASWGTLKHGRSTGAASAMGTTGATDDRDHSLLDELGLGSGSAVPGHAPVNPAADPLAPARSDANRARAYPQVNREESLAQGLDPISPVARDPFAGGSDSTYRATGGDPMTSGSVWPAEDPTRVPTPRTSLDDPRTGTPTPASPASRIDDPLASVVSGSSTSAAQGWRPVDPLSPLDESETSSRPADTGMPVAGSLSQSPNPSAERPVARNTMPDEYMEYEDDFRTDYESRYAASGAGYEEYEDAYRYGATAGGDERYRNRHWDDAMETELQRDWRSRNPRGEDTWERFKLAVRHGWDRVTGHHNM